MVLVLVGLGCPVLVVDDDDDDDGLVVVLVLLARWSSNRFKATVEFVNDASNHERVSDV